MYANSIAWIEVLQFKYGDIKAKILDPSLACNNVKSLIWWHNIRFSLALWGSDPNGLQMEFRVKSGTSPILIS